MFSQTLTPGADGGPRYLREVLVGQGRHDRDRAVALRTKRMQNRTWMRSFSQLSPPSFPQSPRLELLRAQAWGPWITWERYQGRNRKAPPDLLRPFRALACLPICSQGVALGFLMTPRWGLSFCTLIVCDSFSASGTHVLEADLSTLGQSREIREG